MDPASDLYPAFNSEPLPEYQPLGVSQSSGDLYSTSSTEPPPGYPSGVGQDGDIESNNSPRVGNTSDTRSRLEGSAGEIASVPLPAYQPPGIALNGDTESINPPGVGNTSDTGSCLAGRAGEIAGAAPNVSITHLNNPALAELSETKVVITPEDYSPAREYEVKKNFFRSITQGSVDSVALYFLTYPHLLGPNVCDGAGKTALGAAVESGSIRMVKMLLDMGADVDLWSVVDRTPSYKISYPAESKVGRTPLMVAASKGYLPIVRLLFNHPWKADHTLCAPDGQTALRLAADNGYREVVDFLPPLKRGGFRRVKHQHVKSMKQLKEMSRGAPWLLFWFLPWVLSWWLPKALFYDTPKWIAKELWRRGKYIVTEFPEAVTLTAKYIWEGFTIHLPRAITATAWFIWETITESLPSAIKNTGRIIWRVITVLIPKVARFLVWALKQSVTVWPKRLAIECWDLIVKGILTIVSLSHTILVTLFRGATLKDIWNGLAQVLHWLFVEVPAPIVRVMKKFQRAVDSFIAPLIGAVFGDWARTLFIVVVCLVMDPPIYLLSSIFEYSKVAASAGKEILVWFNPKR